MTVFRDITFLGAAPTRECTRYVRSWVRYRTELASQSRTPLTKSSNGVLLSRLGICKGCHEWIGTVLSAFATAVYARTDGVQEDSNDHVPPDRKRHNAFPYGHIPSPNPVPTNGKQLHEVLAGVEGAPIPSVRRSDIASSDDREIKAESSPHGSFLILLRNLCLELLDERLEVIS
jgi:hypothetical protein